MILVTTDTIPGHTIQKTLGLVRGSTARAGHAGVDIVANMKNLVGGEVEEYTKLMAECREQALDRMCAEATALGANAICALRFVSIEVSKGVAELLAYGTAVILD